MSETVAFLTLIVILAGILVLLMQSGFALLVTGLCRAKNAAQIATTNLILYGSSVLGFWMFGFAVLAGGQGGAESEWGIKLFGHPFGFMGRTGFFLSGLAENPEALARFFYFAALVTVAALIPAGVMAERWRFGSVVPYGFWSAALPVALFGNWVWGGGWLAQLGQNLGLGHGFVDFAGSSVIHMAGGTAGLMGTLALGPRLGKYSRDGRPRPMPGHNLTFVIIGTFLVAAGWVGLNIGPALLNAPARMPLIAVNTLLASAAATFAAYLVVRVKFRKPDPSMICNGLLAGLAAICGPCAFVNPTGAVLIGAVAGVLVVYSVLFLEGTMRVDDPVGAISVHGVGGAWGIVSLGLLADGTFGAGWNGVHKSGKQGAELGVTGLLGPLFGAPTSDASQFLAQLIGAVACLAFSGLAAWAWFKVFGAIKPLRSRHEDEIAGLDLPEMGAEAYPDFHLTDKGSSSRE